MKFNKAITVLAVVLGLSTMGQAQPAFITNGLVAYYPFHGDAADKTGNGDSLDESGIIYKTNHLGMPNRSAVLTKQVSTSKQIWLQTGSFRSISYWYNTVSFPQTTPSGWGGGLVPQQLPYCPLPGLSWGPAILSPVSWHPQQSGLGSGWYDSGSGLGFYFMPTSGWHFLTCVYNGDIFNAKVYVDGVPVGLETGRANFFL